MRKQASWLVVAALVMVAALAMSTPAFATLTVTGNAKKWDNSGPGTKYTVHFELESSDDLTNCRVSGAQIGADRAFDVTPDATTGAFSTTIYGNNEIDCAGNLNVTWWNVTVTKAGQSRVTWSGSFILNTPGPTDLNTSPFMGTPPSVSAPGTAQIDNWMDWKESAAPVAPATGYLRTYAKQDHTLCQKTSLNVETCGLGGGGGGGGSGTVTSVSSGDLAPLFTSSVSNGTTTPAISFTLSTFAAHKFYGNPTGGTAAPSAASITAADLPSSITSNTSGTAAALAANGTNCSANQFAQGVDASGNAEGCAALVNSAVAGTGISVSGATGNVTIGNTGALSFNGRSGAVSPATNDYSFAQLSGSAGKSQLPAATVYTDQANTFAAGSKQTFTADTTNAGMKIAGVTADPSSPAAGDLWYRSDLNLLKFRDSSPATHSIAFLDSNITGTAAALAADGTDCSAGQYARGVDVAGNAQGCTSASGAGTVTNTGGALTNNAVMLGAGGADAKALGSLGTTTTVLHGNASGAPSFSAVDLANDVTGVLAKASQNAQTVYKDAANSYTAGMKQTVTADATNAGFKFGGVNADPSSPAAGDEWYRTDLGLYRGRDGAATHSFAYLDSNITGTAAALTANGTNCSAGQYPLGVDASGNAESCTDYASETKTMTNKTLDAEGTGNTVTIPAKVWIPAAACQGSSAFLNWDAPTSTPAVAACVTGTNTQKGVADFADTSGGFSIQTTLLLPADWTGNIDARIIWTTTATSGNAKWSLSTVCTPVNASATDDPAFNTASTVTTAAPGSASQAQTSSISAVTATGCSAGNLLHLKIFRDGNDGSDTIGATARLIGVEVTLRRAM